MRVRLDQIVFDAGTQVRAGLDSEHVAAIAEAMTAGATLPPIVLFHDGNQHYIGDGFHRYMAAQRCGWREIDADVRPGAREDALWFALGANRTNGKNMTAADKRHAIVLALQTWPERSATSLAEQIGCSDRYVLDIKAQVRTTSDLPSRVTGKDGKSYPASRPAPTRPATTVDAPRRHDSSPPPRQSVAPVEVRPPRNGMQFARLAVMKLEEIQPDDEERAQAFAYVRSWIDAR